MRAWLRYEFPNITEGILLWIVWRLPRTLVKWCAVRVIAHATQGPYSNQVVTDLTAIDALKRW